MHACSLHAPVWERITPPLNNMGASDAGDLDNIAKAVKDACNGVLYKDDCRVVSLTARLTKGEPFVCVTAASMHRKDWV